MVHIAQLTSQKRESPSDREKEGKFKKVAGVFSPPLALYTYPRVLSHKVSNDAPKIENPSSGIFIASLDCLKQINIATV